VILNVFKLFAHLINRRAYVCSMWNEYQYVTTVDMFNVDFYEVNSLKKIENYDKMS